MKRIYLIKILACLMALCLMVVPLVSCSGVGNDSEGTSAEQTTDQAAIEQPTETDTDEQPTETDTDVQQPPEPGELTTGDGSYDNDDKWTGNH